MLTVTDLRKRFGRAQILAGVSLSVRAGEVAAVLGPSGGGKTTFLRCLNGLETFDSGRVTLGDVELTADLAPRVRQQRLRALRLQAGMVFQQFHLFPHRTVLENVIEAPVHVLGWSRPRAREAALALLERVGMHAHLEHRPHQLSGGQQQRVAIARALAMQPRVILFDEPTSALDPRMAAEVESVMADLAAAGQTMVVVTHSLRLARQAAHTVYVFDAGQVVESGPATQVLDAPRQEATRRFLMQAEQR